MTYVDLLTCLAAIFQRRDICDFSPDEELGIQDLYDDICDAIIDAHCDGFCDGQANAEDDGD